MDILNRIILKMTSARWLIAVTTTGTFCYLAVQGTLQAETITGIVGIVIGYYFNKTNENKNSLEEVDE